MFAYQTLISMLTVFHRFSFFILFLCMSCCASVKVNTTQEDTRLKDLKTLSSDEFQGRESGTPGAEKASSYIQERFKSLGLQSFPSHPDYLQPFEFVEKNGKKVNGKNIIGYIPGKLKETLVISAHYDHLGIRNGKIYPGADDNASGVSGLLYMAAYFAKNKPNFTLIFTAFDAEEKGLKGSKYFVDHTPLEIALLKLNVNMDMIAHNDKAELYVCGTYHYPQLKQYILNEEPKLKIITGHDKPEDGQEDWTNQSDQGAFHAKGIPFLYFGVEDHKDYHQATDTFENINETFFVNAVDGILAIVKNIDNKLSSQVQLEKNKIMK